MTKNGEPRWPGLILDTHATRVAHEWLRSGAWGLVLASHPNDPAGSGRGKSLAVVLLFGWLDGDTHRPFPPTGFGNRHSRERLYVNASDLNLLDGEDRADLKEACRAMKDCEALFIDDLGAEDETVQPFLRQVLERRGGAEKLTIMAATITPSEVQARYGARFVSRMRDGGLDDAGQPRWIVAVEGEDLRGSTKAPALPSAEEIAAAEREDEAALRAAWREKTVREEARRRQMHIQQEHARRNALASQIRGLRETVRAAGTDTVLASKDREVWRAHATFHDNDEALREWVDAALQPNPPRFSVADDDEVPF